MDPAEALDLELELIISALLPAEKLSSSERGRWPRTIDVSSDDSKFSLHAIVAPKYPASDSVKLDVKGKEMGRGEAEGWIQWVEEKLSEWNAEEE